MKRRVERLADAMNNRLRRLNVVGMRGLIAGFNHFHPDLAILNQGIFKGRATGIARTNQISNTLIGEVVFEHVPGKFMRELEALDQALLFKRR